MNDTLIDCRSLIIQAKTAANWAANGGNTKTAELLRELASALDLLEIHHQQHHAHNEITVIEKQAILNTLGDLKESWDASPRKDEGHVDTTNLRGLGLTDAKRQEAAAMPAKDTGGSPDGLANHTLIQEAALLDPDMPAQKLRLHMGELTAPEMRVARAAIRWANSCILSTTPAKPGEISVDQQAVTTEIKRALNNPVFKTLVAEQLKAAYIKDCLLPWLKSSAKPGESEGV